MIKRDLMQRLCVAAALVTLIFTAAARAEKRIIVPRAANAQGMINLPYSVPDNTGNQWMIYPGGWFQQQGNQPIYSNAAMLLINGAQPQMRNNLARIDPKTGELVFENMQMAGCVVTRRVLINREDNYVRYIDTIKNTQGAEQTINLQLQSTLNYGVNVAQIIPDPRKKDQNLAWVAQTGSGRTAVEVFAGKGAKFAPAINWPPGNNVVQANLSVPIPANKEIALMHLHSTAATQDAGTAWVNGLKDAKIIATLPKEIRRSLVNFSGGENFIGDTEILRGELLDVVELRGGDQLKGTLREQDFKLQAFYGTVTLPVEKVVGVINVGQFRPRQLVITTDGQIIGGKPLKETIDLELSSGQVTQVPVSQVSRVGYRKRPGDPEDLENAQPTVQLRTGERLAVVLPTQPIAVASRYGNLQLDPAAVAAIVMQSEEHGAHDIYLVDGSKFVGFATADAFELTLAGGESQQPVRFPISTVARLQLTARIDDRDDSTAAFELANDDLLAGSLTGEIKIETAFDTITVNAAEVRRLTHNREMGTEVQITLWDQSSVSGQLQDADLVCKLASGVTMKVPVALVEEYNQPQPQPSAMMVEKIKLVINDLNAEDWKQRERAEAQLAGMGPVVIGVLKQVRGNQPPEAQQRIDTILKQLEKPSTSPKPAGQENSQ